MRQLFFASCVAAIVLAGVTLSPGSAQAFPAFARAYKVACTTCHTVITRRSEFGEAFRLAGYRWPGPLELDANTRKPPPVEMPGMSFMVGDFPATWIFSARATLSATYAVDSNVEAPVSAGTPSINLIFGGTLGEHVSLIGKWSALGPPSELFLYGSRIGGRPELNLIAGRTEANASLFRSNDNLLGTYRLHSASINGFVLAQPRQSLEANGILFGRGFYAVGVAQSSDTEININAYYQLRLKVGGTSLLAEEPDLDLEAEESWTDHVYFSVAQWGYWGQVSAPDGDRITEVRRLGMDAEVRIYEGGVRAGVMVGLDQDQRLGRMSMSVLGFAEATYSLTSWLVPVYLYEFEDSAVRQRVFQQHSVGILFVLLENVRIRFSGGYSDDKTKNEVIELEILAAI